MPHKRKELNITGPNLWYLVGLIASDGCLSKDGRHINITSKDYEFLRELKAFLGLDNKIGIKNKDRVNMAYYIDFSNKNLYEFLFSIGLTPCKSLTQDKIDVPHKFFYDFLRGLIDGDGGIQRWIHSTNKLEQWNLRIASGSKKFLEWLEREIKNIIRVKGGFYREGKNRFRLKYGKMAARIIAKKCYCEEAFALKRKKELARDCINSYMGWERSSTVIN